MCLLCILCRGLVSVSVACAHLGVHIWRGDGASSAFYCLEAEQTQEQVCAEVLLPREG